MSPPMRLAELLTLPGNNVCADCGAENPRWVALSPRFAVFICIRCSGIHRSLGTHISRVRSVELDSWTHDQLDKLEMGGNERTNYIFEGEIKHPHEKPRTDASDNKMKEFIVAKYVDTKFKRVDPDLLKAPSFYFVSMDTNVVAGDKVCALFRGDGLWYSGEVESVTPRETFVVSFPTIAERQETFRDELVKKPRAVDDAVICKSPSKTNVLAADDDVFRRPTPAPGVQTSDRLPANASTSPPHQQTTLTITKKKKGPMTTRLKRSRSLEGFGPMDDKERRKMEKKLQKKREKARQHEEKRLKKEQKKKKDVIVANTDAVANNANSNDEEKGEKQVGRPTTPELEERARRMPRRPSPPSGEINYTFPSVPSHVPPPPGARHRGITTTTTSAPPNKPLPIPPSTSSPAATTSRRNDANNKNAIPYRPPVPPRAQRRRGGSEPMRLNNDRINNDYLPTAAFFPAPPIPPKHRALRGPADKRSPHDGEEEEQQRSSDRSADRDRKKRRSSMSFVPSPTNSARLLTAQPEDKKHNGSASHHAERKSAKGGEEEEEERELNSSNHRLSMPPSRPPPTPHMFHTEAAGHRPDEIQRGGAVAATAAAPPAAAAASATAVHSTPELRHTAQTPAIERTDEERRRRLQLRRSFSSSQSELAYLRTRLAELESELGPESDDPRKRTEVFFPLDQNRPIRRGRDRDHHHRTRSPSSPPVFRRKDGEEGESGRHHGYKRSLLRRAGRKTISVFKQKKRKRRTNSADPADASSGANATTATHSGES